MTENEAKQVNNIRKTIWFLFILFTVSLGYAITSLAGNVKVLFIILIPSVSLILLLSQLIVLVLIAIRKTTEDKWL